MKIAIAGYSGSGKSTLAEKLGRQYGVPVLHLDTVQFLPGWENRPREERIALAQAFLDENAAWVIDGNYFKLSYEQRMAEADKIVLLLFPRLSCLLRVITRYRRYRGTSRPDVGPGCPEKLDGAFVRWILFDGRTKEIRNRYRALQGQYPEKVIVCRNQKELDRMEAHLCSGK